VGYSGFDLSEKMEKALRKLMPNLNLHLKGIFTDFEPFWVHETSKSQKSKKMGKKCI
jgi:hypothetical protein